MTSLERMGVGVQCQVTHKLQTCLTGPSPPPSTTFIGWDPTATLNQPVSCHAISSSFFLCVRGNDITAPSPATNTLKTDELQTSFRWGLTRSCTRFSLCCNKRTSEAKQPGHKTAFLEGPLWNMSAGRGETPRDSTCQSGAAVFFSNPLMSGE